MSISTQPFSGPPQAVQREPERALKAVESIIDDPGSAVDAVRSALVAINPSATSLRVDAFERLKSIQSAWAKDGVNAAKLAVEIERAREASRVVDPTEKFTLMGKISMALTPIAAISNAIRAFTQYQLAKQATKTWLATGSSKARDESVGRSAKLLATTIGTGLGSAESFITGRKLLVTYSAAKATFETLAPKADIRIARAAGWAAAKHLLEHGGQPTADVLKALTVKAFDLGVSRRTINASLRGASIASVNRVVNARVAAKAAKLGLSLTEAMGTTNRLRAQSALRTASRSAGRASMAAGAKAATGIIARGLARFAPGLNVALAVLDTAQAYSTFADPKASTVRKVTSAVTAGAAWVAATNVLFISPAGALVSMVSAFVGAFF